MDFCLQFKRENIIWFAGFEMIYVAFSGCTNENWRTYIILYSWWSKIPFISLILHIIENRTINQEIETLMTKLYKMGKIHNSTAKGEISGYCKYQRIQPTLMQVHKFSLQTWSHEERRNTNTKSKTFLPSETWFSCSIF